MNDKRMNNFGSAPGTFHAFTVKQLTSQSMGRIYLGLAFSLTFSLQILQHHEYLEIFGDTVS